MLASQAFGEAPTITTRILEALSNSNEPLSMDDLNRILSDVSKATLSTYLWTMVDKQTIHRDKSPFYNKRGNPYVYQIKPFEPHKEVAVKQVPRAGRTEEVGSGSMSIPGNISSTLPAPKVKGRKPKATMVKSLEEMGRLRKTETNRKPDLEDLNVDDAVERIGSVVYNGQLADKQTQADVPVSEESTLFSKEVEDTLGKQVSNLGEVARAPDPEPEQKQKPIVQLMKSLAAKDFEWTLSHYGAVHIEDDQLGVIDLSPEHMEIMCKIVKAYKAIKK